MALGDFIKQLLSSDLSCEVDPLRLCNGNNNSSSGSSSSNSSGSGSSISSQLEKSRQQLTKQVETAWRRILACQHLFPYPLKLLFSGLRHRLEQAGRTELTDNCMHRKILSSSIFLRFLCPAILSPSLFGLVSEYPTGKAARNLTLIAKSLQTLANFTRFGGKEAYMEFMNIFVEREWRNMQHFLRQISAPCARYCQACEAQDSTIDCTIDLGKELSLLASYMREHCDQLLKEKQQIKENGLKNIDCIAIKQLWNALMIINNWGNKEENFKNKLKEENEKMAPLVTMEGFGGDHSPGNPPSDYENNITTTTKIVPPPIPLARRAIIPQPIDIIKENKFKGNLYGGESCQPISAPPVTNSPFSDQKPRFSFSPSNISPFVSTAAVHHLNTTDDYVLSSALNKLRTTKNLNNNKQYNISSSIHLYDETPRREQQQQTFSHLNHLYDEVATEHLPLTSLSTSASRALNSGVVIAHRGVASHETTKHRGELCTVIQRNTFRTVDDEADDESESGEEERVEEIEEENEELQRRTSQRRHHLPNDVYSHKHCSSGEQNYLVANFDSSSASATSNNLKNQMVIMPPSSGYQSQLNSSSYSNSSSPTNTAESSPPPLPITTNKLIIQSPKIVLKNLPKNSFSSQLLNQSNNKNINSCQSSSSSASSAYSSLSPTNQQNNNKLRKSAENAAMHLLDELKSEQTKHDLKQQNQLPKPRTNPSCWSVPGFSGQIQPRSAFIGSNPTDPLTAFVRYPLLNSTTTSKQQQISPKEIEEKKLFQKFPTCSELFFNENNTNISRFNNQNILSSQNQQTNLLAAEMELIEAQRYQIAELTRENAALRHELKTVRAVSSQHIANREEKIKASTESM